VKVSSDLSKIVSSGITEDGIMYSFGGSPKNMHNEGLIWLTNYKDKDNENASRLKTLKLSNGNILLMWDIYIFSADKTAQKLELYKLQLRNTSGGNTPISDTTAPSFKNEYPKIDNITQTTVNLKVQINENGKAYYVVLADGATVPTDVKADAIIILLRIQFNKERIQAIMLRVK